MLAGIFKNKLIIISLILLVSIIFLFLIFYITKISKLKTEEQKDIDKSLSLLTIPKLPRDLSWSLTPNKEFTHALIVDNSDFVEKRDDIKQVYIDLSGEEYISQPISEDNKPFEERLRSKINEYFQSELDKNGFQWRIKLPNYKITLSGLVADSPMGGIAGFIKYRAGKIRMVILSEELVINPECKVENVDMWNIDEYPECYFGNQFKVFVSDIVRLEDIIPKGLLTY